MLPWFYWGWRFTPVTSFSQFLYVSHLLHVSHPDPQDHPDLLAILNHCKFTRGRLMGWHRFTDFPRSSLSQVSNDFLRLEKNLCTGSMASLSPGCPVLVASLMGITVPSEEQTNLQVSLKQVLTPTFSCVYYHPASAV